MYFSENFYINKFQKYFLDIFQYDSINLYLFFYIFLEAYFQETYNMDT